MGETTATVAYACTVVPMAWTKVPAAHHPIFREALPRGPRVTTLPMFGGVAAKANGTFFAGLFSHSVMVHPSS